MSNFLSFKEIKERRNNLTKFDKLKYLILRNFKNITSFPRQIFYGIENFFKWRKIIWNDRDWDFYFLLKIMEFKLKNMSGLHKNYGVSKDRDLYAKQLRIASKLCTRLIEDKYFDKICKDLDNCTREDFIKEGNFKMRDLNLLSKIINKYLFMWWD